MREPRDDEERAPQADVSDRLAGEDLRRRVLRAFAAEIEAVGYVAATPEAVAARAQVPVARIDSAFGGLGGCYVALYDSATSRLLARIDAAIGRGDTSQDRLQSGIDALLGWCADEPRMARLCIVEVFAVREDGPRLRAETMRRLAVALVPPLRELRPTDRLAELGAQAIVGAAHELMYAALASGTADRLPEFGRDLAAVRGPAVVA